MSALSREIGSRGRADAVAVAPPSSGDAAVASQPEPGPDGSTQPSALRSELGKLKMSELRKRAATAEAAEADIAAADDAEDPKTAMIVLILAHEEPSEDPAAKLRAELEALKPSALRKRAKAMGASGEDIEGADDSDDPKAAIVELLLRTEAA